MDISKLIDIDELKKALLDHMDAEADADSSIPKKGTEQIYQKQQKYDFNSSNEFVTRKEFENTLGLQLGAFDKRVAFIEDLVKTMVVAIADD